MLSARRSSPSDEQANTAESQACESDDRVARKWRLPSSRITAVARFSSIRLLPPSHECMGCGSCLGLVLSYAGSRAVTPELTTRTYRPFLRFRIWPRLRLDHLRFHGCCDLLRGLRCRCGEGLRLAVGTPCGTADFSLSLLERSCSRRTRFEGV